MCGVTYTSHLLLDSPDGYLYFPYVLICGACVQMGWFYTFVKVFKFIVAMVVGDDETSIFIFGLNLHES